jgi:hypothetical protein
MMMRAEVIPSKYAELLFHILHSSEYTSEAPVTQLLTLWSGVLLEKPPVTQLLKKFPIFYGTQRFITVFTRALH